MKLSKHFILILSLSFCKLLQADQVCSNNIIQSTPSSQFTLDRSGTATDNKTGLTWMRCSLGTKWMDNKYCVRVGDPILYDWKTALNKAYNSNFAGYSDWRLPNIKELNSIVEVACRPSANIDVFKQIYTNTSLLHWTSTPYASDSSQVFIVAFGNGQAGPIPFIGKEAHIRLVRGN